ncbi:MAG: hypothetical protein M2R45_05040 [Verrucomicrobia subdivision 3 bacterium]|nr:hypothetical protein [Limisphaerales bacterium]MCS1412558.1 hypothetical protein [Limisphaerales bacterium]
MRQLELAIQIYADEHGDVIPPRISGRANWLSSLKPYYVDERLLVCPTDGPRARSSCLINGFNDYFAVNFSKEAFEESKEWQSSGIMGLDSIPPNPTATIMFGEKYKESPHNHMGFYQGEGNDFVKVNQAKPRVPIAIARTGV